MMNFKNFNLKSTIPHIIAELTFLVLTLVYFSPVLEGKDIKQDDAIGSMGWGKDARDYHEESGEYSYWSNASIRKYENYKLTFENRKPQ